VNIYTHTLSSIVVLGTIVLLVVFLRRRGVVREENAALFAALITRLTLPALIFFALSHSVLEWKYLMMTGVMFAGELAVFVLARLTGGLLGLSSAQMGSFLLASVFGSSALLGYALIVQVFPGDANVLAEATFISELGVGLPLFTFGVMIAIYYGSGSEGMGFALKRAAGFFRSPIFAAIVAGSAWSLLELPLDGAVIGPVFDAVRIVGKANTLLVTLLVGVTLHFNAFGSVLPLVAAAVILKLGLEPAAVAALAGWSVPQPWQLQVLVIESAMPSAMLGVALAKQYGCDTPLASRLVFATLAASVVTVGGMLRVLG